MNIFDIIIAGLLLFAFVRGIMKGFLVEVASLVAIIAGVYVAIHYAHYIESYLQKATSINWSDKTNNIVAFTVTFLTVILVVILIGKTLTKLADITALGMLNKILGGVFGTLKIALFLSVSFTLFGSINNKIPFIKQETLDESILYNPVKKIAPVLFPSIIKESKEGEKEIIFN
jgi:membrane protein required for colicin V production